jgi:hypothetical protein
MVKFIDKSMSTNNIKELFKKIVKVG